MVCGTECLTMMLNFSGDTLLKTLNIVLSELNRPFFPTKFTHSYNLSNVLSENLNYHLHMYIYLEYENLEELRTLFDATPVKVIEAFFLKCWTKEYLANPLVH